MFKTLACGDWKKRGRGKKHRYSYVGVHTVVPPLRLVGIVVPAGK